jgi:UDP-glucose 4-epimerase
MTSAVVTGGAGFIGSHLTEELLRRGYQVTVFDNLSTGKRSNIEHLATGRRLSFVEGSVGDLGQLRKILTGADIIFHQAAIASVPGSIRDPIASHAANATGTLNVLVAAADCGVKKIVCASSSAVYGDSPVLPKVESMIPDPRSPYAVTKLVGEHYCSVFREIHGLAIASLRYFNVYGPRQDPNSPYAAVIPLFFRKALSGEPPVIYGSGEQSRDFIYVKDVVTANILAAESGATGVFNIGSGKSVTVNQLAQLIIELVGNTSLRAAHQETRTGDILHSVADISRARGFGYEPSHSLEEGLRNTLNAFT